jgi:hypothetical protein
VVVTTIFEEEVTCAVCGSKQTVHEMGSTSSFGPMDLDTRPPPLQRGTMEMWVHECTDCGFVAPELGIASDGAGRIVASADYRAELAKPGRVRQASRFVCRSLLDEAAGDLPTAGWRRLHAAWVCDDVANVEEAREQRRAALELFERARAQGKLAMKSVAGGDQLLLADLARRSGEFEQALEFCEAGLKIAALPAFVAKLLAFQRELVLARDVGAHTVAEVETNPAGNTVH